MAYPFSMVKNLKLRHFLPLNSHFSAERSKVSRQRAESPELAELMTDALQNALGGAVEDGLSSG